ncbi:hypothetical protein ABZW11_39105 [Nonomuraea sp. NPDC004580]|uniref:VOC family protein n=1 Tax=Nonomuraea sp. NPDC004580 TaxID=3154552 RepID=UPI0033BB4A83
MSVPAAAGRPPGSTGSLRRSRRSGPQATVPSAAAAPSMTTGHPGLAAKGVTAEPPSELGERLWTSWLTDPDGYRIELVQWPPGHPPGMTAADFA